MMGHSTKLELKLQLSEHGSSILYRSDDIIHHEMIVQNTQLFFVQPHILYELIYHLN